VPAHLPAVNGDPHGCSIFSKSHRGTRSSFGRDGHPPVIEVGAKSSLNSVVFFVRMTGAASARFSDTVFGLFNSELAAEVHGHRRALVSRMRIFIHGGRI